MIGSMCRGDRRKQMRYDLTSRIRYRALSNPGEEIEGFTFNISISGVCIDFDRPVAAGQDISITKCILPYFQGIFSVRWVEKVDTQSHYCYRAGLMFSDTTPLR
jgi:c-di-GMP-binding flagellar brake protein YcgR